MRIRKLYDAEAELLRLETLYLEDEGAFDDNWIVSASDIFRGMHLQESGPDATLSLIQPLVPISIPHRAIQAS